MDVFFAISLTMSIIANIAILAFLWSIRDLVRFFFKFRRIITRRGWLKLSEEDLEKSIDKIKNFMEPVMHPKKVDVTEDGDIDFSKLRFMDPEKSPSERDEL